VFLIESEALHGEAAIIVEIRLVHPLISGHDMFDDGKDLRIKPSVKQTLRKSVLIREEVSYIQLVSSRHTRIDMYTSSVSLRA